MKTSIKATLIATAIATLPFGSQAAGLGSIHVFSGLGQPLRAEIELSATPQELQSIAARIASPDAFRAANVTYSPALTDVRVAVEARGNRSVLKLSSERPVNEPFIDLLLELNWASGRLLREYTFLLDPVQLQAAPAVATQRPPAATPATSAGTVAPAMASPAERAVPADRYQVQRGDTLRGIADRHRPQSVNLDQMLIALFRENPEAFDGSNINRLRAGAILQIPDASTAGAVDRAQARREIVAQAADFEAYRRSLAGAVASRAPEGEPAGSRAGAGAIVPAVEEPQRPGDSGDRVKVSGAPTTEAGAPGDDPRLARLQALEEELVAREKQLEETTARLVALEANLRDMQKLLELRSQDMAQLQGQAEGAAPSPTQPAPTAPAPTADATPAPAPVAPAPAVQPKPQEEPSFLQTLLQDPTMVAAGGGVLALLLGYGGYRIRQRRKDEEVQARDSMAMVSELPPESKSVFGSTGGQSVNTTDSSVIQTDFSQSGMSAIDADEGVDPVAEADVYMAYGRDAQAEEILLDALKADGSRLAVYLKLLEIYAQRKSVKQFETVATDLYSRTSGEGAEWAKAADMGRKLDPENPLYRTSGSAEAPPVKASAGATVAGAAAAAAAATAFGATEKSKVEAGADDGEMIDLDFGAEEPESVEPVEPSPSQLKDTWAMPGDLGDVSRAIEGGSDEDLEEAVKSAAAPEIEEVDTPAIDADALDFNLDIDAAPTPKADAAPAAPGPDEGSAESAAPDLEFDLDIGDDGKAADGPAQDEMEKTMAGDALDFLANANDDASISPDAEAGSDGFDLNATVVQSNGGVEDADAQAMDLEKTSFDSSLLDFDFDLESDSQESSAAPSLDLNSIDLNLEPHEEEAAADAPELTKDAGAGDDAAGEPSEEVIQEVDTKLELARAYEEMGDKDGARELVEEVLREGSSAQREAAKALMERLV